MILRGARVLATSDPAPPAVIASTPRSGVANLLILALLVLGCLVLTGCQSSKEKADRHEARYDRLFAAAAFPAARRTIQAAVDLDPDSARRWLKLARVRDRLNQPAAAAEAYQHALDLEPDNLEALQSLTILSVRARQYDLARRYLEPLLLLAPNDPAGLLAQGAIAVAERRFDEAERAAKALIELDPARADGYVLRARMLDANGRTREAAALMDQRSRLEPGNKDLLSQLLTLYRKLGDREGVRDTAIRLMPLEPRDPRYALEAARAYYARGQTDRAEEVVAGLRSRFAASGGVMTSVAALWRSVLPADEAATRIVRAGQQSPPSVKVALGRVLVSMARYDQAIALIRPLAVGEISTRTVDVHGLLARALATAGRIDDADAQIAQVLAFDEGQPEALIVRARRRLNQQRYRDALNDAQRVLSDDETNEEASLLVAQILAGQGSDLLAAGAFGNARQAFPDSVDILRAEIAWLRKQKRYDEAAQRAAGFLASHAGNAEAQQLRAELCRVSDDPSCRG
jgi:tetratricopeptide (TPR) repeat protein